MQRGSTADTRSCSAVASQPGDVACKSGAVACKSGAVACKSGAVACKSGAVACKSGAVACKSGAVASPVPLHASRAWWWGCTVCTHLGLRPTHCEHLHVGLAAHVREPGKPGQGSQPFPIARTACRALCGNPTSVQHATDPVRATGGRARARSASPPHLGNRCVQPSACASRTCLPERGRAWPAGGPVSKKLCSWLA